MHAEKPCVCKYFRVVWHIILLLLCERIILSYEDFVDCKYEYIFSPHDPIWRKRIYWLETHAYIWHSDITSLLFSKSKRSLFLFIKILKSFDAQFKFWCLIFYETELNHISTKQCDFKSDQIIVWYQKQLRLPFVYFYFLFQSFKSISMKAFS